MALAARARPALLVALVVAGVLALTTAELGGSAGGRTAVGEGRPPATTSAVTTVPATTSTSTTTARPDSLPAVAEAGRPVPRGAAPPSATPPAEPVRVEIASIGVRSDLEQLGLGEDGSVQAPVDPARAGWFRAGTRPGAKGPAVIAGHLDWTDGPAVFARLADVVPGDTITVTDAAGAVHTFAATKVEQHPKEAFPTQAVYGPVPGAALRLVTCGGAFNRSTGHYLDNIVVFAQLVSER